MPSDLASKSKVQGQPGRQTMLRRFLETYWLRPENALWMTLRSDVLRRCPFDLPSVDLCCGDGVFSFLHHGGMFDPAFDVFGAAGCLNLAHTEHADMFNHTTKDYCPKIVSRPGKTIDVGLDLKPALLSKASRLNVYEKLVQHDLNQPLPFADDSFQTVYCNAAYWVGNIDGFLSEIARITRPGGDVILQVKLDSLTRYTLGSHRSLLGDRFLDIIGGGRVSCWPTVAGRNVWEARFAAAGLIVEQETPFITRTHAHLWDIGLRPIAPLLVRMANALTPETRASIKRDWVDLFREMLDPICDPDFDLFPDRGEPGEIQYTLRVDNHRMSST